VLMPVAADMELGRKEAYLEPLNALLGEARAMMRAYLLSVSEVRRRSPRTAGSARSGPHALRRLSRTHGAWYQPQVRSGAKSSSLKKLRADLPGHAVSAENVMAAANGGRLNVPNLPRSTSLDLVPDALAKVAVERGATVRPPLPPAPPVPVIHVEEVDLKRSISIASLEAAMHAELSDPYAHPPLAGPNPPRSPGLVLTDGSVWPVSVAGHRARVHARLERLAAYDSCEDIALPSPSLEVHVLSNSVRGRSSSIMSASLLLPMTFELALDAVIGFLQEHSDHIVQRFPTNDVRCLCRCLGRAREGDLNLPGPHPATSVRCAAAAATLRQVPVAHPAGAQHRRRCQRAATEPRASGPDAGGDARDDARVSHHRQEGAVPLEPRLAMAESPPL